MKFRIPPFLVLFILVCSIGISRAQRTYEKLVELGGSKADGNSLIAASDGGYLAGGNLDSIGKSSYPYLTKFDKNGNVLWAKYIGSNVPGRVTMLSPSTDGNFFAVGYTYAINSFNSSRFIMKLDAAGNTIWTRYYQTASAYTPIAPCDDGGCLLGGNYTSPPYLLRISGDGSLIWEESFTESKKGNNSFSSMIRLSGGSYLVAGDDQPAAAGICLMKIDLSGTVAWYKTITASSDLFDWSCCKTSDGGFAVCGVTSPSQEDKNLFVAKFDSSGSMLWGKEIDAFGFEEAMAITEGAGGDLFAGCFSNPTGAMIARIDKGGATKSLKTLTGSRFYFVNSIVPSEDGGCVFSGALGDSASNAGKLLLGKADASGSGCDLQDRLFTDRPAGAVAELSVTSTFGGTIDSADLKTGADLQFTETNLCSEASVSDPVSGEGEISLSPNPLISEKSISIHVSENIPSGSYEIRMYDLLGNEIKNETIMLSGAREDISFDVSDSPSGIYVIELRSQQNPYKSQRLKFIKQ